MTDSYPHDLAGPEADPPLDAPPDLIEAWREYEDGERELLAGAAPLYGAADWIPAPALLRLLEEADEANPKRDKRSDGAIGDDRHASRVSDHNPDARRVVCARDFDRDGLDVAGAFERARRKVLAGKLPQLVGGYLIYSGRITSPDFRAWREYTGPNPHVTHGHVSVAHDPKRADARGPWDVWTAEHRPTTPRPAPTTPRKAPPRATRAAGDLRGRSLDLRGEEGAEGPRVAALQRFFRRYAPLYARRLEDDGVWGPKTTAVLRQFAQRSGVRSADGRNIGPQIARKLVVAGFRG